MADVIHFDTRLQRSGRRQSFAPREGKVLFFTGVRYERLGASPDAGDDTPKAKPATGGRLARRKKG